MPRDQDGLSLHVLLGTSVLLCAALLLSCSDKPSSPVVIGTEFAHPEAAFTLTVPEGWHPTISRTGLSLVRTLPYGGGYPTLTIRRIGAAEAKTLSFDGSQFDTAAAQAEYRYQRWHNPRGSGYRLEVIIKVGELHVFVEASVWDPARTINQGFFEQTFWPIINSIHDS